MHGRRASIVWMSLPVVLGLAAMAGVMGLRRNHADPAPTFLHADRAYRAGQLDEADAALKRLERLRAPTSIDHYLRAQVDIGLKRDAQAIVELAAIPDDNPLAPLARLRTGQIEIRLGRTRPAEAAFLAALKLLPRAVQPHKELVYIYNIQHRQAELDAQLLALVDLNAIDFQIVLHWTKTRNTNWKPAGDLPALQKFVAADHDDLKSQLALVDAFYRLNRLDEAERILERIPVSDPDARAKRIAIAMDRGDYTAAEALLAVGDCQTSELARLRAQFALKRGDGRTAVHYFRIAYAADPFDRVTLSGLGTALRQIGELEAALPYIEAATRHDQLWRLVARASTPDGENDPAMPHEMGMACAAAGRLQEARAWLKLAIDRNPLDSESQRTLFELEHRDPSSVTIKPVSVSETTVRSSQRFLFERRHVVGLRPIRFLGFDFASGGQLELALDRGGVTVRNEMPEGDSIFCADYSCSDVKTVI